jgi:hypothetical protein
MYHLYLYRRSEFIGCLTVSVRSILDSDVCGSFMLQPQSCLAKPTPLVVEVDPKLLQNEATSQHDDILKYLELGNFKTSQHSEGRTPFTVTTTITKSPNESFGFEISWTKPPKIETLTNHSQFSDLRKGDFIIFVGETNIVSMPKEEIENLIKEHEHTLTLEVFRPNEKQNSRDIVDRLAMQNTPVASKHASSHSVDDLKSMSVDLANTPKSRQSCHFKHPKICFQPEILFTNGVIV